MRTRLLTAALLLALAADCRALSSRAGTSGAQFLKLGAGARAGGMADNFAAIANDAYAAYYNPAGLTGLSGTQLAGAHSTYFEGMTYSVVDFAVPFSKDDDIYRHALAFGLYHLSVADIERRTSDSLEPNGTFGASDGAYAVSYAHAFDRHLSLGLTGKYIAQSIDSYNARSYAADAAAIYHLNPDGARPLTVAAVVKNVGSKANGYVAGTGDPMPTGVTLAAACRIVPRRFLLDLEVSGYRDTDLFAGLGGEYTHPFSTDVSGALRFGYNSMRKDNDGLNGMAMGAGVNFYRAALDFAWQPFGALGDTFRYSLIVRF